MVGKGLKTFAAEKGLKVSNGVAYGIYRGFMLSMQEGNGWKSVAFAVRFPEEAALQAAVGFLNDKAVKKQYRISGCEAALSCVSVTFSDNPGTMKRICEFIEVFCDKLVALGGVGATHCSSCGQPLDGSAAVPALMNGTVFYMHSGCLERDAAELLQTKEEISQKGNIATGVLGALLGAVIGAIPWAIAYYFGWFVAILGLLIGIAAKKGYELLQGKECKAKGVVIILATVFGVFLGESAAIIYAIYSMWLADPEIAAQGVTILDAAFGFFSALFTDSSIIGDMAGDIFLGLLFAGLGIYPTVLSVFKSTGKKANMLIRLE